MPRYNLAFRDVVRRDQVNSIFNSDFNGASQYEESGEFRASKEYKELTGAFENDISEENEDDVLTSESSETDSTSPSSQNHSILDDEVEEEIERMLDDFVAANECSDIYVAFWKKHSQEFAQHTKILEEDTGAGNSNEENMDTDQTTPKKSKRERRVITMPLLTAMLEAKNNGDEDTLAVMVQKLNARD
ncbi:hypothetical protein VNI00_006370 [Paramarasmius palmivorus]|uniref:Uncharacterized protein n=1 Tax=Paramarasmius palmivorus TaxID=297713 RepID=A0AAW0D7C5_9AGAR